MHLKKYKMAVHQEIPIKPKIIRPVTETRKVRKPLMERKRRERINNALEQLAVILKEANLVAADKPVSKIEKADILELTVRHLRGENSINELGSDSNESQKIEDDKTKSNLDTKSSKNDKDKKVIEHSKDTSFFDGFHKCFHEVRETIEKNDEFVEMKDKLLDHLSSCEATLCPTSSHEISQNFSKATKRSYNKVDSSTEGKSRKRLKTSVQTKDDSSNKSSTEKQNLTLVPMRLADGNVAFMLQGDSKILIENDKCDSQKIQNQTPDSSSDEQFDPIITRKLPIPPMTNKIWKNTSNSTISQCDSIGSTVGNKNLTSQTHIEPQNNNSPIIHYSISVGKVSAEHEPVRVLPKMKTATLPVATTVSPLINSSMGISSNVAIISPVQQNSNFTNNFNSNQIKDISSVNPTNIICSSIPSSVISSTSPNSYLAPSNLITIVPGQHNILPSHSTNTSQSTNYVHILPRSPQVNTQNTIPVTKSYQVNPQQLDNPCPGNIQQVTYTNNENRSSIPNSSTTVVGGRPRVMVFPPTPPPSVPLSNETLSPFSPIPKSSVMPISSVQPSDSPVMFTGNFNTNGNSCDSSMSLLSSSVTLLSDPTYGTKGNGHDQEPEEDEFIDVENVSRDEKFSITSKMPVNDPDMWRPW